MVIAFIPDQLGATCVQLLGEPDRRLIASGCFVPGQPWKPIELRLPGTSECLLVEQLRP